MNLNYTTGIPNAPNNPSSDQPIMQTNANSINTWVQQDHIGFNTDNGGYHLSAHCKDFEGDPTTLEGFGTYYAKTVGSDIQGFYKSGLGVVTQLTGATAPSPEANGYVYLPGGILLQWGSSNSTASSTTRSFPIPFPNNVFSMNATLSVNASTGSAGTIYIETLNLDDYTVIQASLPNSKNGYYWFAIGN